MYYIKKLVLISKQRVVNYFKILNKKSIKFGPGWCGSVGHHPVNQRVDSSIPGQGTCLGCGSVPSRGSMQEATD